MVLTLQDLIDDPTRIEELRSQIYLPEGVSALNYDPHWDHHPDNLPITMAVERFIQIGGAAIDSWKQITWWVSLETGNSIIKIL